MSTSNDTENTLQVGVSKIVFVNKLKKLSKEELKKAAQLVITKKEADGDK